MANTESQRLRKGDGDKSKNKSDYAVPAAECGVDAFLFASCQRQHAYYARDRCTRSDLVIIASMKGKVDQGVSLPSLFQVIARTLMDLASRKSRKSRVHRKVQKVPRKRTVGRCHALVAFT